MIDVKSRVFKKVLVFTLVFSLISSILPLYSGVVHAESSNYIQNMGVETGSLSPESWITWTSGAGSLIWDSTVSHTGSKSLKITQSSGTDSSLWFQYMSGWSVGQTYTAFVWVKTDNVIKTASNPDVCLGVDFKDAGGSIIETSSSVKVFNTCDWTKVSVTFTVPTNTAYVMINGKMYGTTGTAWFDDFRCIDDTELLNGNSESGSSSPSNFSTWTNGSGAFTWDDSVYFRGYRSFKIQNNSSAASTWYQDLQGFVEGRYYCVEGFIKTQNVTNNAAYLSVEFYNAANDIIGSTDSPKLSGTNEWRKTNYTFWIPAGTTKVRFMANVYGGSGTAWFDELKCSEVFDVKNGNMEKGTSGTLDDWSTYTSVPGTPTFMWDSSVFKGMYSVYSVNVKSIKISQSSSVNSSWLQYLDGWDVGKKYKVFGYLKSQNISTSGGYSCISIDAKDCTGAIISTFNSPDITGTTEWKYVSFDFQIPQDTAYLIISLKLYGKTGTLWCDDVTMMEDYSRLSEPAVSSPWWNNWPRFTRYSTDMRRINDEESNVITAQAGAAEDGRAKYFSEYAYRDEFREVHDALNTEGYKRLAWIEGQGELRSIIGAVNNLGGGNFEMDPITGLPKLISHYWNWDQTGYGVSPSSNQIVWMGVNTWADRDSWNGTAVRPDSVPVPTYPNGTPATGYLDSSTNPSKAKLFDAMASKDITGRWWQWTEGYGTLGNNQNGACPLNMYDGSITYAGYVSMGMDQASPWWTDFKLDRAEDFLSKGVNGFWTDNYSGYNFIGGEPVKTSFGDYSIEKFKDYLVAHPEVGVANPQTFNIKNYIISKFSQWYPSLDSLNLANVSTINAWKDSRFNTDTIWKAFLAFKADTSHTRAHEYYDGIKSAAQSMGKNPDDILVQGNDIPKLFFGSVDGDEVDMASVEYSPGWTVINHEATDGMAPYGHAGTFYSLAGNSFKSRHAEIWYYLDGFTEKYAGKQTLSEVLLYEALMKNVFISSDVPYKIPQGEQLNKNFNRYLKSMTNIFGDRKQDAKIGIVYSSNDELYNLLPGGWAYEGKLPNLMEFYGWGTALEDLNFPYKAIPDYKLTSADISDFDVLILPHMECISSTTVNNVLIPFANSGKKILVSSNTAGSIKPKSGSFLGNTSALLYDLVGQGKAQFISGTPGKDFYLEHQTPGTDRTNKLNTLQNIIEGLITGANLTRELQLNNLNEFVLSSRHYDETNNVLFVDLLNENIDIERDTNSYEDGGTIVVNIPSTLASNSSFDVKFYDEHWGGASQSLSYTKSGTNLTITVPGFWVYGSIVIK